MARILSTKSKNVHIPFHLSYLKFNISSNTAVGHILERQILKLNPPKKSHPSFTRFHHQ